jgi:hypothetical protein
MMTDAGRINKRDFLGIDAGTASARLKKALMFSLVVRLSLDICFRCNCRIETPDDLSVDHKQPWLNVSRELFWDLGNIAFSHRACNKTDRPKLPKKFLSPDGMSWCSGCKRFKDKELFSPDKDRGSGTSATCRECRSLTGQGHASRKRRSQWRGRKLITADLLIQAQEMVQHGSSARDAASALGVARSSLSRHLRKSLARS